MHRPRPAGAKPEQVRSRPGDQARMHLGRPVPAPGQCPRRPSRAVVARTRRRRSLGSGGAAPRHLRQHAGRGGGPATGAGTARPARAVRSWRFYDHFRRRRGAGAVSADRHPYTGAGRRRRRPGRGPADHPRDRRCGGAGRGGGRCLSRQPPAHRQPGRALRSADRAARPAAAAAHRGAVGRHPALPAVDRRPVVAAAAGAAGAQRTGNQPASRPAAGPRAPGRPGAQHSQVLVVSHAARLVATLEEHPECHSLGLEKDFGETRIQGLRELDRPAWYWPVR